jgi:Cysteine-rich CPCC
METGTNGSSNSKYPCVCCGYKTMNREDHLWEICPVCFWESDPLENTIPGYKGGANKITLKVAQQNFILFGACDEPAKQFVRPPNSDEPKDDNWKQVEE